VTCFLCCLIPACYATMGRLRFLRGLFRGNNSQCNSGCFLCGLFTGYKLIAGQLRVTSEYSGRAAVFREQLQSCRRTDPAILEERQRVKIQCEDSESVILNCSEP
jgi:hypothetical protein